VISDLARSGVRQPLRFGSRCGVPILKVRDPAARVRLEIVNALCDEAR
jgi:hypothetical protein